MRNWQILALISLLVVLLCAPAAAERFHVSTDGLRTAGPSTPGDWSPANCYATLSAALGQSAPADSVLLARQAHTLTTAADLPAFLGNADLDADLTGCSLAMIDGATLDACTITPDCTVRGIEFVGPAVTRDLSALRLDNTGDSGQSLTLSGCRFTQFWGSHIDGGSCLSGTDGNGLDIAINDCEFLSNQTGRKGGAIHVGDGFTVTITGSLFLDNMTTTGISSEPFGGAISVNSPNTPTHLDLDDTVFTGNKAARIGGTICIMDGSLTAESIRLTGSRSAWDGLHHWCAGAGIMMRRNEGTHTEPIAMEIRNSFFEDNVGNLDAGAGAGDGGAVMVRGSSGHLIDVTVEHCDFFNNYNDQGAGLYVGRFTNGDVNYCRFRGNSTRNAGGATFKGGGLAENLGETATYRFCEFIDNTAGVNESGSSVWAYARGGAFSTREAPRAYFFHCTFLNNVVAGASPHGDAISLIDEGGTFDSDLERCVMVNCVFWGENGNDMQVRADALGFSLVQNCAWQIGEFTCSGFTPTDRVQLLSYPFANGPSPTPAEGSPLVDGGVDLGLSPDLAGLDVPQGEGPDIGAYEYSDTIDVPSWLETAGLRLQAHPNPFNPAVVISCNLAAATPLTVEVLDVKGRRVATLHQGPLSAGDHHWRWDGRDHRGRHVAGGTYLARAHGDAVVASRKLMLIK